MSYRGDRVLVLGATGFIGRHVAEALAVVNADIVISGPTAEAVNAVAPASKAERLACDVLSPDDVAELLQRVRPAFIFNLAGYGVRPTERDPVLAQRINAELPGQLAELAAALGATLIHTGSALEYGTAAGDLNETTACTPTTLYGQTKLAGTNAIRIHSLCTGSTAVTARLFTVYGPGEIPGRLLPALIEVAKTRKPLPLTDGKQQRDFTYVGDVVEGLLRLGKSKPHPGSVVNLATGRLATVRRFVESAARVLDIDPHLLAFGELPTRAEEMAHDPVSIRRLRELTGGVPTTSIEDGVRKTAGR
ncbi:MAG TPA: NAD(P)-dependent oxidoreductase [Longimicrobiales bacterium]